MCTPVNGMITLKCHFFFFFNSKTSIVFPFLPFFPFIVMISVPPIALLGVADRNSLRT